MADYEKNVSRNIHKHNAYRKAANTLAAHPSRIKSGDEAKKLNGVGQKIAEKIDEFIQTGKLRKIDNVRECSQQFSVAIGFARSLKLMQLIGKIILFSIFLFIIQIRKDDTNQAITELTRVTGIGPAKAQELVRQGLTSIADLEKNKDKLNHHQLIGLK